MKKLAFVLPLFVARAFAMVGPMDTTTPVPVTLEGQFMGTAAPCRITEAPTSSRIAIVEHASSVTPANGIDAMKIKVEASPSFLPQLKRTSITGPSSIDGTISVDQIFEMAVGTTTSAASDYDVIDTSTGTAMLEAGSPSSQGFDSYENLLIFQAQSNFDTSQFEAKQINLTATIEVSCNAI